MDQFILNALFAGLAVVLIAGPLGVFILWRRMAYFGDSLSHSAILGVALGFLLHINVSIGVLVSSVAMAALLILSQRKQQLANDTVLGILSHSALALGLIVMSFVEAQVELGPLLFGDILSVTKQDLWVIFAGVVFVLGVLAFIWKPLLSLTVHEELAQVEGVNIKLISAIYTLLIAVLVAVAMKVVGALLVTSLLIIPAASAKRFSKTPEQMAFFSVVSGAIAVVLGLTASFLWDTPAGPSIVVSASSLFLLSQLA